MLRISHVKNVNNVKKPLTPVKFESKNQGKKVLVSAGGIGLIERQEEATSHLVLYYSIRL